MTYPLSNEFYAFTCAARVLRDPNSTKRARKYAVDEIEAVWLNSEHAGMRSRAAEILTGIRPINA
jgi:hypothetical protein